MTEISPLDRLPPFGGTARSGEMLADALERAKVDVGALFEPAVLNELQNIRQASPAEWARIRQQAKDCRVSTAELDRLTAIKSTPPEAGDIFPEITPWPERVNGSALLAEITDQLARHVVAERETLVAGALWVVMTWVHHELHVSPTAWITAPEKRCGKSVLLTCLGRLVFKPLPASSISPAALFRAVERWEPTLLIDEADSFARDNEELRGILNSGFNRDAAFVIRCTGDDHEPTRFSTWSPKALCGIGSLPDTVTDRAIPLRLRRKLPAERVTPLRHSDRQHWQQLREKLARWTDDHGAQISSARPADIPGLNDRAQDAWEPLQQIALVAGGDWPAHARKAALALHGADDDAPSIGVELLGDVRAAFDTARRDRLFSADLLELILADDESPWATWNKGRPMTARQLAKRLGDFGVHSRQIRIGAASKKGYLLGDFQEHFARYLAGTTPAPSETTKQPSNDAASGLFVSETLTAPVSDGKRSQPSNGASCFDVSDTWADGLEVFEV